MTVRVFIALLVECTWQLTPFTRYRPRRPSSRVDTPLHLHPGRARVMLTAMDKGRATRPRQGQERAEVPTMRRDVRARER